MVQQPARGDGTRYNSDSEKLTNGVRMMQEQQSTALVVLV